MTKEELDSLVESVYHPEHIADCLYDISEDVTLTERLHLVEIVQEHIKLQVLAAAKGEVHPIKVDESLLSEASADLTDFEYEEVCQTIVGIMEAVEEELFCSSLKGNLI
jgi:hypothetical protein